MPLSDLDKKYSIIHIAGKGYRVRYSLNAFMCLDNCYKPIEEIWKTPPINWSTEDILQLVRAALCDLPRNRKAVINRDWKHIKPDIAELGEKVDVMDLQTLKKEIVRALNNSFPKPVIGEETNGGGINYMHMRALYCDIMHRPDGEFWTSNFREIQERTDAYLEVKGLKEPTEIMQMYED